MKRSQMFINFFFFVFFAHLAFSEVVKLSKEIKGRGTLKWTASATSGPVVLYRLLLDNETLWQFEYKKDENAPAIKADPFRHSQLIDVYFADDKCSFILSGYEGIHFFLTRKINGTWLEQTNKTLFGISASAANPLKEIALGDSTTVRTVSVSGVTNLFSIQANGSITKNGVPYVNKLPDAITIESTPPK